MVTSSFKLTMRRSSLIPFDVDSSTQTGRSRRLIRYSDRFLPPSLESYNFATPRGKFVNMTRGSGFMWIISLHDLADEFFGEKGFGFEDDDGSVQSGSEWTGLNRTWPSSERFPMEAEASRRRGRSMSKKGGRGGNGDGLTGFEEVDFSCEGDEW